MHLKCCNDFRTLFKIHKCKVQLCNKKEIPFHLHQQSDTDQRNCFVAVRSYSILLLSCNKNIHKSHLPRRYCCFCYQFHIFSIQYFHIREDSLLGLIYPCLYSVQLSYKQCCYQSTHFLKYQCTLYETNSTKRLRIEGLCQSLHQ